MQFIGVWKYFYSLKKKDFCSQGPLQGVLVVQNLLSIRHGGEYVIFQKSHCILLNLIMTELVITLIHGIWIANTMSKIKKKNKQKTNFFNHNNVCKLAVGWKQFALFSEYFRDHSCGWRVPNNKNFNAYGQCNTMWQWFKENYVLCFLGTSTCICRKAFPSEFECS